MKNDRSKPSLLNEKRRSVRESLDDFEQSRPPKKLAGGGSPLLYILGFVGLVGAFGAGYVALKSIKIAPAAERTKASPNDGLAVVSYDEIKANAAKAADKAADVPAKRTGPYPDPTRANVGNGQSQIIDGVEARITKVWVERDFISGIIRYLNRSPLLAIEVSFRSASPGESRTFQWGDVFPRARLFDEHGRKHSEDRWGAINSAADETLVFSREHRKSFYFELPAKGRPMDLDVNLPATGPNKVFRFHIPQTMTEPALRVLTK